MNDPKALAQERRQIFEDTYDGIIPKRVPIHASLYIQLCIQYAGLPLGETQWTLQNIEEAMDKTYQLSYSDNYPAGISQYPAHLQIMGSRAFVMGSGGFFQHPEVSALEQNEYDDYIKNPHDFVMEKVLPRLYPELDTDPITRSLIFAKAVKSFWDYVEAYSKIDAKLIRPTCTSR
ncbi:MAG: hypothetical protein GX434_16770 [Peptococcaceae bacterium]|nr:hypothetical protein [Peptococcaceae bacterium]